MGREYWIDGFNFFHQWETTRESFAEAGDVARMLERALRLLDRYLGTRAAMTRVFLDGGLDRREARFGRLRVRYSGPGRKADDRMADDLQELGERAREVMAVSNDRELKADLRLVGAVCLGVGEFLAHLGPCGRGGGRGRRAGKGDGMILEKFKTLSNTEVEAWLDFFGGEPEDGKE